MAATSIAEASPVPPYQLVSRVGVCAAQLDGIYELLDNVCTDHMAMVKEDDAEARTRFSTFLAVQAALRATLAELHENIDQLDGVVWSKS